MRNLLGQSESILPCENGQCLSFVQSSALVDRRRAVVAEDRNAARRPVGGSGHVARRPESWFGRAVYAVYARSSLDTDRTLQDPLRVPSGHSKIPSRRRGGAAEGSGSSLCSLCKKLARRGDLQPKGSVKTLHCPPSPLFLSRHDVALAFEAGSPEGEGGSDHGNCGKRADLRQEGGQGMQLSVGAAGKQRQMRHTKVALCARALSIHI